MHRLTLPTTDGKPITHNVQDIETLAEPPVKWASDVGAGRGDCDCTNMRLRFSDGTSRYVYWDGAPFVRGGGERNRLSGALLEAVAGAAVFRAADVPPRQVRRRSRSETRKMPETVGAGDVEAVYLWPLGATMTRKAAGEEWTDCLIVFVEAIRVGGAHNSRRVRYDGRFYITHNGRRVEIGGALVFDVLNVASHVYGVDAESDKTHNKVLKGY